MGYTDASDVQLRGDADRNRIQIPVQQVNVHIRYGTTDGKVLRNCARLELRLGRGRRNAGLGRTIRIHPAYATANRAQPYSICFGRGFFPAYNHQPQIPRAWFFQFRKMVHPLVPISGGQIEDGDFLVLCPIQEFRNAKRCFL